MWCLEPPALQRPASNESQGMHCAALPAELLCAYTVHAGALTAMCSDLQQCS